MTTFWLTTLLIGSLLVVPARADQIDYVLQFNSANEAQSDVAASKHFKGTGWDPDHAMSVAVTRISTGNPVPGTFVMISSPLDLPDLDGHAKLYLEIDRDKCNARAVGCIVQSHAGAGLLQDIQINPVYEGADMPWGALQ